VKLSSQLVKETVNSAIAVAHAYPAHSLCFVDGLEAGVVTLLNLILTSFSTRETTHALHQDVLLMTYHKKYDLNWGTADFFAGHFDLLILFSIYLNVRLQGD